MGVLDFFKKKPKQLDLPPPPPPELLQLELPKDDLELPALPELPPMPEETSPSKAYEIPPLEEEFPLPLVPELEEPLKTIEPEEQVDLTTLETKQEMSRGPIFIKVDDYRGILESVNLIRNKINESDYIIEALNDLKTKIDAEFEKWREELEEMQRKVMYMDKALFEGR